MYQVLIVLVTGSKVYRLVDSIEMAHFELFRVSQLGSQVLTYKIEAV